MSLNDVSEVCEFSSSGFDLEAHFRGPFFGPKTPGKSAHFSEHLQLFLSAYIYTNTTRRKNGPHPTSITPISVRSKRIIRR